MNFDALYPNAGCDSISPEKRLCAQVLVALYTIGSERQLMEQIDDNRCTAVLLVRRFID